jgi:hypothetical protein
MGARQASEYMQPVSEQKPQMTTQVPGLFKSGAAIAKFTLNLREILLAIKNRTT